MNTSNSITSSNFIHDKIDSDLEEGKNSGKVVTRFPPEPNGYLHIGHAKSICLNFGTALKYKGKCHLRFDDTNPSKEETEYVESIMEDVKWLGFDWGNNLFYASDYFGKLYDYAEELIKQGKAYVCDLKPDEIREYRGTLTRAGKDSPYRSRSAEENLDLFRRMKAGEFANGERVLRAKIDMKSGNINMRDPVMYRIQKSDHHRTGGKWCIYPMYDFTHCLSDSIEGITHSLCTLEFENNRPLYDWFLDELKTECHPQQIEFARLNLNYTVMSKRKLLELVRDRHVNGWDDPRMPTISGLRRRGYTPESIRDFCDRIGVSKADNIVDIALLEHCLREDLNKRAQRVMAVLRPVRVIIDNYPDDKTEDMIAENNPEDETAGTRIVKFSKEIYIEEEDFMEDPPKKYFRLSPGNEVRLKHAYIIKCESIDKDKDGNIIQIHCTYDELSKSGGPESNRKVKGTLHWVSAAHCIDAEIRIYNHLFTKENPESGDEDYKTFLNKESMEILNGCKVEQSLDGSIPGQKFQFLRQGYFCTDPDSIDKKPVFNRSVSLRDTWAKIQKKEN